MQKSLSDHPLFSEKELKAMGYDPGPRWLAVGASKDELLAALTKMRKEMPSFRGGPYCAFVDALRTAKVTLRDLHTNVHEITALFREAQRRDVWSRWAKLQQARGLNVPEHHFYQNVCGNLEMLMRDFEITIDDLGVSDEEFRLLTEANHPDRVQRVDGLMVMPD